MKLAEHRSHSPFPIRLCCAAATMVVNPSPLQAPSLLWEGMMPRLVSLLEESGLGSGRSWSCATTILQAARHAMNGCTFFFFFITLGLEMSDTKVYEP